MKQDMTQQCYKIGNSSAKKYDNVYVSNVSRLRLSQQCKKAKDRVYVSNVVRLGKTQQYINTAYTSAML